MQNKLDSYLSAEIIPSKLISNPYVLEMLSRRKLQPVHIQLNPTNKCNLRCKFCSCSEVDRKIELPLDDIKVFYDKYKDSILSTTITGGGEPLKYLEFDSLVHFLTDSNIDIGMATNGLLVDTKDNSLFDLFTWIRISLSDISLQHLDYFSNVIDNTSKCDWAFSFVCGEDNEKNYEVVSSYIHKYGNQITHMRVVNDILCVDDRVDNLIHVCEQNKLDTSKIIFQTRTDSKRGSKDCRISILKPVIAATGNIYTCCGAQYAIRGKEGKYCTELQIGHILDETPIPNSSFNGSICDVCYYDNYNQFINLFYSHNNHENFI